MKFLTLLIFCVVVFSACPKVGSQPGYNLGESIMLNLNEPIAIPSENISLLLTDVKEGRCPKDVNCIQAGNATINIDMAVGDAVSPLEFRAKGNCMDENKRCGGMAAAQGYSVQLIFLYPYPSEANQKDRKYAAKVLVTKK